jgi:hypothetical protein
VFNNSISSNWETRVFRLCISLCHFGCKIWSIRVAIMRFWIRIISCSHKRLSLHNRAITKVDNYLRIEEETYCLRGDHVARSQWTLLFLYCFSCHRSLHSSGGEKLRLLYYHNSSGGNRLRLWNSSAFYVLCNLIFVKRASCCTHWAEIHSCDDGKYIALWLGNVNIRILKIIITCHLSL